MTSSEYLQVRGPTSFDGRRWHVVVEIDGEHVSCACGERYELGDRAVEISPVGENPDGLSGNSICYGCTGSDAVERAVDDDCEVIA